jgi:hypothetical protein
MAGATGTRLSLPLPLRRFAQPAWPHGARWGAAFICPRPAPAPRLPTRRCSAMIARLISATARTIHGPLSTPG